MDDELLPFLKQMNTEVMQMMDECPTPEVAFTKYIVNRIYTFFDTDDPQFCYARFTKANGDVSGEIHGYALSRNGEVLTLFYSLTDSNSNEVSSFLKKDTDRALRRMQGFYVEAVSRYDFEENEHLAGKDETYDAARAIYEVARDVQSVVLCVLSNGNIGKCEIDKIRIPNVHVEPLVWDLKKLFGNLRSGKDHDEINIDFAEDYKYMIPYIKMESEAFQYQCILAMFPAKLLYRLYEKYNTKLLLSNVRYYLGTKKTKKNSTNAGMIETLEKENQMFLAYNNGITALATGFEDRSQDGSEKIDISDSEETSEQKEYVSMGILKSLQDFRIVNGGQTTATLFEARNPRSSHRQRVSYEGVYVQVKILVFNNDVERLASDITRYSNTQNPIKPSDFSVSCPFNKTMEDLSRHILIPNSRGDVQYWFFERLRGQFDVERGKCKSKAEQQLFDGKYPKECRFSKEDVARVRISWMGQPHDAVKGIGTTYEMMMKTLDDGRFIPDENFYHETVALLIIYRMLYNGDGSQDYKQFIRTMGNAKATVVAYTMAFLKEQTFGNLNLYLIWQRQRVSSSLWTYLKVTAARIYQELAAVRDSTGKTILSYGKTKEAWMHVRSVVEPMSYHTIDEDLSF